MRNKKTKKIIALSLFVVAAAIPIFLFGQDAATDDKVYANSLTYFQGEGVIEEWFAQNFIYQDFDFLGRMSFLQNITEIGRAIGALGALIYFGWMGNKAVAGEGTIEYMPMVKVAIFASILLNWMSFASAISTPFKMMEAAVATGYQNSATELNGIRNTRYKYQTQLNSVFYAKRAELNAKEYERRKANGDIVNAVILKVGSKIEDLTAPIFEAMDSLDMKLANTISAFFEKCCLFCLRVCVYLIFIVKTIFLTFLIAIGPIALGISFFPGFENTFVSWLSRFVNVSLYGVIAFIILNICMAVQIAAYRVEVDRYKEVIDSTGAVKNESLLYTMGRESGGGTSFGAVDVAYILGAMAILMTPKLADMVISAGGNSTATATMGRTGATAAKTAVTVARKVIAKI